MTFAMNKNSVDGANGWMNGVFEHKFCGKKCKHLKLIVEEEVKGEKLT